MLSINPYIFLNFSCLIFILIIGSTYLENTKIKIKENKVYTHLLLTLIISLILEIVKNILVIKSLFLAKIVQKLFLISIAIWNIYFLKYSIIICKDKKLLKSTSLLIKVLSFIIILAIIVLPVFFNVNNNMLINCYGIAKTITEIFILFICFISTIILIRNIDDINQTNEVYIIIFIFLIALEELVQILNPNIELTSFVLSIITSLIYFYLENPDLKLIAKLNLAIKQSEQDRNAKNEFLSSMSHEIRTPLNAIVVLSECIKNESTSPKIKEDANSIVIASKNLLDIVKGVLDISILEAGNVELTEKNYDLKAELTEVLSLINTRIIDKDIILELKFLNIIPDILYGDIDKIKTIITNFLTNSLKYTEKGKISLIVDCVNNKNYSKLIISVKDTGVGIKKEHIKQIFSKFQRLDKDINTSTAGIGVGLAIAKSLAEILNGKIEVISTLNEGSTFKLIIKQKIIKLKKEEPSQEKENKKINFRDKKILVVDDNLLNLKVASRILNNYDIYPDVCTSGLECIEKLKKYNYDLIFMDDMMPQMSGTETLTQLKNNKEFKTPVVSLTANALAGIREHYLKIGFDDYLAKPIDRKELLKILSTYLN